MKTRIFLLALAAFTVFLFPADAGDYSIASADTTQVLTGNAAAFSTPAEVDFEAVVRETEAYRQIRRDKAKPGSARYFILLSDASEKALSVVSEYAADTAYDLVAISGYLERQDPPIAAQDVTHDVIEQLKADQ